MAKKKNFNPKSLENLKPQKKGEPGRNKNGRPKKLVKVIKSLPEDIQEQVYKVLGFVLTLPDEEAAKKYLTYKEGELGEYGFVMQVAIKQLTKEGWGWGAVCDILRKAYHQGIRGCQGRRCHHRCADTGAEGGDRDPRRP